MVNSLLSLRSSLLDIALAFTSPTRNLSLIRINKLRIDSCFLKMDSFLFGSNVALASTAFLFNSKKYACKDKESAICSYMIELIN
jgi:hypothetical protein